MPRILYLEDNPIDVELLKATLSGEFTNFDLVHVASFPDFEKALADATPYDLIIVDHYLPSCDIRSVIRAAKQMRPDRPVLCLTGARLEFLSEAEQYGADYFLEKGQVKEIPALLRNLK